jgi:hypothetical protein
MKTRRTDIDRELAHLNTRLIARGMKPYELEVWQAQVKGNRRFLLQDVSTKRWVSYWSTAREMYSILVSINKTLDYITPTQEA